jgi:septal ring factor EnvC (AmiA/AmiB activator)
MASSTGAAQDGQEPRQGTADNWQGYFTEALKIIQEHRKELSEAKATTEAHKLEISDLKRRLTKSEDEKKWMHSIIEQSHKSHDSTIAILNDNSERLTLHVQGLESELAGEKLCHQEEIKILQRKLKSSSCSSKTTKTDTADASTWVDNLSGHTRWADLYDPSGNE